MTELCDSGAGQFPLTWPCHSSSANTICVPEPCTTSTRAAEPCGPEQQPAIRKHQSSRMSPSEQISRHYPLQECQNSGTSHSHKKFNSPITENHKLHLLTPSGNHPPELALCNIVSRPWSTGSHCAEDSPGSPDRLRKAELGGSTLRFLVSGLRPVL